MDEQPILRARGVTKRYPAQAAPALDALDLDVRRGEMLAVLGPSGSGKSTLLRLIAGLEPTTSGTLELDGRDLAAVPAHRRDLGVVFQSLALLPHLDVAGNVAFGLEMRRMPPAERTVRVRAALDRVRLGALARRRVSELSGGQQQRVALARALVIDPVLLLLDEPLSALDAGLRVDLRTQIRELQRESGTTAIFVTHDQDDALQAADRVAVLRDGRLVQLGTPEQLYDEPVDTFVAGFVGRANLFAVEALDGELRMSGLGVVPGPAASGSGIAMIRPHVISIGGEGAPGFAGVVRSVGYTGDLRRYAVDAGGRTFEVEQRGDADAFAPGDRVRIGWPAEGLRLVRDAGPAAGSAEASVAP